MIVRGPTWLHDLAARAWEQHQRTEAQALPHLVRPAMPILFFGDSAEYLGSPLRAITVGLNPSCEEFPRDAPFRRFSDCASLSADGAPDLPRYLAALNAYFRATSDPYDAWFGPSFEPILRGMGASYYGKEESFALHTDLCSPLATSPTWTRLDPTEQSELQRDGVRLWHDLVEELQPDVVLVSVRRALFGEIRFPARGEERIVYTVLKKNDGTNRKRPYRVSACRRGLRSGKEPLFVSGHASQTPFGSVSAADKLAIGARIRESLVDA